MLVLSRKSQESVVIGGSDAFHRLLKVTVLDVRGTNVRLGFEVDASVPVHRLEVWERIHGNGNGNGNGNDRPAGLAKGVAAPLTSCPEPAQQ